MAFQDQKINALKSMNNERFNFNGFRNSCKQINYIKYQLLIKKKFTFDLIINL